MNTQLIAATGMVWYLAEDFDEVKALMADSHTLHRTHAEWQRAAENGEKSLQAKGGRVYRAIVRPEPFKNWCDTRGLNIDAKARNQFASEFAMQEYRAGR